MFVDGLGLGEAGQAFNPLLHAGLDGLRSLASCGWDSDSFSSLESPDLVRRSLDANLGVEGLPQSGTGQATLFTGVNCAQLVGRHHGPYPHSLTRPAISKHNIFSRLESRGLQSAFANAYPPQFFDYVERTDRWTVTTRCCLDAGVRIRRSSEIAGRAAVSADLTGLGLRHPDPSVPLHDETFSADTFSGIARSYAFTLFEYFMTDKAGHRAEYPRAIQVLESLDRFLGAVHRQLDYDQTTLIVTSDHGNIEDLRTGVHTRNPVPLIARGWAAEHFRNADTLTDVAPAIDAALATPR